MVEFDVPPQNSPDFRKGRGPIKQLDEAIVSADKIEEVETRIGREIIFPQMRCPDSVNSGDQLINHLLWDGILNRKETVVFKLLFFCFGQTVFQT
jgi:hypothetical protein